MIINLNPFVVYIYFSEFCNPMKNQIYSTIYIFYVTTIDFKGRSRSPDSKSNISIDDVFLYDDFLCPVGSNQF